MYDYDDDFDFGIDLSDVEETTGFDVIPAGKYTLQCVNIELADARSGGKMVKATFEVLDGEYRNRKVFENYNVQHQNSTTVAIASGQIKQWLSACGLEPNQQLTLNVLRPLEGREFLATVSISKDKNGVYADRNRIKKYEALAGTDQTPRAQPSAPVHQSPPPKAAQPAPPAGGKMPWQA